MMKRARTGRKSNAQIRREVDKILSRKPGERTLQEQLATECPCVAAGECNCHRMHITERCECPACEVSQASHKRAPHHHAVVAKSRPWQGTNYNEQRINSVRNALVSIHLDGVVGISPVIRGHEWRQIEPSKADAYLQKGKEVLDELASQKVPASAKGWYLHNTRQLRDLLEKAQAVRDGALPQKMTAERYAELQRYLSRH